MKPTLLACTLACGAVTLLVAAGSPTADLTAHPDSSAWPDLFQDDLSNAESPPGVWTVERGVLTASEDKAIWTDREYERFVLDLEFRTAHESNSGVIVYCSNPRDWIPNSIEIQIADDHAPKWAHSPPTWRCGAIFGRCPPTRTLVKQPGQWNRLTIACDAHVIRVWLNGHLVNTFDMLRWTDPRRNPDGSEIPPWLSRPAAQLPTRGRIGFQGKHGDAPIWFRNIRIRQQP